MTPPMVGAPALLAAAIAMTALASPIADYSEILDRQWDFDAPGTSEGRFRAEQARHPAGSREALEAWTQVARTLGLQRKFADADRVLDAVEASLPRAPARVRVRYLLERGRVRNSSGDRTDAIPLFEAALATSGDDHLPGAAYYRIDALHMLGIAAPAEAALAWNLKALDEAERANDARSRGWRASILNNLGWTMHERGDYAQALAYWQRALALREAQGDVGKTRIARWTVARGLRSLGRLDEAEAIQRALAIELEAARAPDGYVFEELAEIAVARGDPRAAQSWAAKAYALLGKDADLRASEPARLERLARLAHPEARR
ncbi:MAG: tetratricopeptide repeat protein [Betaproteobacteria bacterium]|nr:tetratricopeptide repeat protein [Betaproteobacteria bacterium]MDE2359528.1 tetratricopeptide repeat protein [Betaproteobacteria bacterium]